MFPKAYGEDHPFKGERFCVGDVVYLKSGSQPMAVMALHMDGRVTVGWQNYYGEFFTKSVPNAVLTSEQVDIGPSCRGCEEEEEEDSY